MWRGAGSSQRQSGNYAYLHIMHAKDSLALTVSMPSHAVLSVSLQAVMH